MRALVTGANGMLGSALVPELVRQGWIVQPTDIDTLDVRKPDAVREAMKGGWDRVFHLAALTDLEECEADHNAAQLTNALGTLNVALAAAHCGVPMVYISTAGIFDGESLKEYSETDSPRPLNAYARAKLAGETYVRAHASNWIIARAGWMIGGGRKDHKFVSYIVKQIRQGADRLYVVADRWGAPTYTLDFSRCLLNLVKHGERGLFHMVNEGLASRVHVAEAIVEYMGAKCEVVPVLSDHFPEFWAPRPYNEALKNARLAELKLNLMRPWREALDEYLYFAADEIAA